MTASYPAKVLLFGEHTVLRGGRGLAVPFRQFSLRWELDAPDERLLKFCDLKENVSVDILNWSRLEDDLLEDWRLVGNIPEGYGLGSSGAVCAAVFDRYATAKGRNLEFTELQRTLAIMEGHFHGESSGTDPLVSYLQRPVLIGDGPAQLVDLPEGWNSKFFLVDTGRERKATTLINRFLKTYDEDPDFRRKVEEQWKPLVDRAINALISGDTRKLRRAFYGISDWQMKEFRRFIPVPSRKTWQLEQGYALKICGAGGGGMLLGLSHNKKRVRATFGSDAYWLAE